MIVTGREPSLTVTRNRSSPAAAPAVIGTVYTPPPWEAGVPIVHSAGDPGAGDTWSEATGALAAFPCQSRSRIVIVALDPPSAGRYGGAIVAEDHAASACPTSPARHWSYSP